jgi:RNA polymerase sigma-70 factor, ECF subfamily
MEARQKGASAGGTGGDRAPGAAPPDDRVLVTRAQAGDTTAFDELVNRYADKVHRLTYKVLRHEEDAADALQDAFLSAYRNLPRFKGESTFSTWLYRVAMNAALMRLRKRREGMVSLEQPGDREGVRAPLQIADWARTPAEDLLNAELREALQRAVDALPEDLAKVFVLREWEGNSNAEVAEILEISIPAVKSRLHRARVALRDFLNRYFAERAAQGGRAAGPPA